MQIRHGDLIKSTSRRFPLTSHYGIADATEGGLFIWHNEMRGIRHDKIETFFAERTLIDITPTKLSDLDSEQLRQKVLGKTSGQQVKKPEKPRRKGGFVKAYRD
jgi:hypothetical protein